MCLIQSKTSYSLSTTLKTRIYSELVLNNPQPTSSRRRGQKRFLDTSTGINSVELKRAYHQPIPISKALHIDLMSLCRSGTAFYESLIFTTGENTETAVTTDTDVPIFKQFSLLYISKSNP